MKTPKFYNKDGSLTRYGLACGYVECKRGTTHKRELYMEHSHYIVRYGQHRQPSEVWEVFSTGELTKARKLYKSLKV